MAIMEHRSADHIQLDRDTQAQEFAGLGRLANQVPVRRLHRGDDLDALSAICDAIVSDVADLSCNNHSI